MCDFKTPNTSQIFREIFLHWLHDEQYSCFRVFVCVYSLLYVKFPRT